MPYRIPEVILTGKGMQFVSMFFAMLCNVSDKTLYDHGTPFPNERPRVPQNHLDLLASLSCRTPTPLGSICTISDICIQRPSTRYDRKKSIQLITFQSTGCAYHIVTLTACRLIPSWNHHQNTNVLLFHFYPSYPKCGTTPKSK